MKINVQLTLDGLINALRVKAHDARDATERRRLSRRIAERDLRRAEAEARPMEDGDARARP